MPIMAGMQSSEDILGNSFLCFYYPGPRDCNVLVIELTTLGLAANAYANYAI